MSDNSEFVNALKMIRTKGEYVALQCATILNQFGTTDTERRDVIKIITQFWSESTTREFIQKGNWDGQLALESSLILADDHPIHYALERRTL